MPRIRKTKDYGMFVFIDKNRQVLPTRSGKLMNSITEIGNHTDLIPIVVHPKDKKYSSREYPEGKYPVMEGQGRFVSLKLLGEWVYFVIDEQKKLKIEHLPMLQTSEQWKYDDYMNYYCQAGFKEYAIYAGYKKRSGWSHNCVMILLSGNNKGTMAAFKAGTFKISRHLQSANKTIEHINEFGRYIKHYKNRSFVTAMLKIMDTVDEYDKDRMMQKIDYLSERLVRCPDTDTYISLLEKLYNFKSIGEYVSFRR